MSRYVTVNITSNTTAVSQAGFGMPLIFSTSGAHAYKEYHGIDEVANDFGSTTEEYSIATALFSQTPKIEKLAIYGISYVSGTDLVTDLTDALNTLIVDHDDWYFLTCTENAQAEVEELASWINTQEKMYFVTTDDTTVFGGALNSERTSVLVHKDPTEFGAEAWVGKGAPYDPGSITWTFKTLNGISNAGYANSDVTSIENANGNTYIKEGGVLITSNSKTTTGDYIDVIRSRDFLKARIQEGIFSLLANSGKVPFTNAGIAQVVSVIESVMKQAYGQGIIADDVNGVALYTVSAPTRSEVSSTDRANRHLPDVEFTATLAGAVESVEVSGTIQV